MKIELSVLIKMQKIDDKITELEVLKAKLPKQLDQLISNVKIANENQESIQKLLEENRQIQKTHENDIKANNDLKIKYSHQLDGIKNNKEYKALNSQITALAEKNTQIESQILFLMEEETNYVKQKEEAITLSQKADENLAANENILKKEIEVVNHEIEVLKENRLKLAKQISDSTVKKYIQLIKFKNRKAVVFCNNNACSGCGFHIRPQILIELNNQVKIIFCENCGRMLVKTFEEV